MSNPLSYIKVWHKCVSLKLYYNNLNKGLTQYVDVHTILVEEKNWFRQHLSTIYIVIDQLSSPNYKHYGCQKNLSKPAFCAILVLIRPMVP